MPVAISIQWKPLRDSHYIVASLRPGGAGLRQIFARQSTLREVQALARGDEERPVVGLLLGERLSCSLTAAPYVLIESHVDVALASLSEHAISEALGTLREHVSRRSSVEVLGWFCRSGSADAVVSPIQAAVHAACFAEPWQTVLTLGDARNTGAFFLHDSSAARWFHAPFYEVVDLKASTPPSKATCTAWPAYLTSESVVPLTETPPATRVPVPAVASFVSGPVSTAAGQRSVAFARPVVRTRRTPTRDAIVGVGRAAVSVPRSALGFAKSLAGRAATASRRATGKIFGIRGAWVARAAQRKAEADALQAREAAQREERAAEQRAARQEAQRRAAQAQRQRAAEAEARRAAEAEAQRIAADEAQRFAVETEARRMAAEEAQRIAAAEEQRRVAEAEAERIAAEAEAEAQRAAAEAEAEIVRKAAEVEEEARRKAAQAEQDARRQAAESEALTISVEVSAIRERLARAPVEGSKPHTPRAAASHTADLEDTTASDGPYRYLALARREGFEVSESIDRGDTEHQETFWLLHEKESGLRLIVVTTDEEVREASLHYNLRTDDDSVLLITPPEHRDLESRTIYGREACVKGLRARCRRLRATGALEREWKAVPTYRQPVAPG